MRKLLQIVIMLFTLLASIGCDQVTKTVAKEHLPRNEVLSFVGDTFRLQYAENRGAFLSLGSTLADETRKLLFTVGNGIILAGLLAYLLLARALPGLATVALSLIAGGGISNLIDRVAYNGYVVDFLNIGFGGLRTGIFNIADVAIMAGGFLFVFSSFKSESKRESF